MAIDLKTTCNKPNYRDKADYGVRVARPGYDANTCAQNQLLFNSGWPIVQITRVIDMDKEGLVQEAWLVGDQWQKEAPAGATFAWSHNIMPNRDVAVGKNYVYIVLSGDSYNVPDPSVRVVKYTYKKFHHGLGYQPMFYRSETISEIPRKIVLTSVDLATDVDYPYTEKPSVFIKGSRDYGIKSSSIFKNNVPGLSTGMFSRLVQAVKTQETSQGGIGNLPSFLAGSIYWSPLKELKNWEKCLEPYDARGFIGYRNPFGEYDSDGSNLMPMFSADGPFYFDGDVVRAFTKDGNAGGGIFGEGVGFTNLGQAHLMNTKSTMVITRSPMVSPEYEEITV